MERLTEVQIGLMSLAYRCGVAYGQRLKVGDPFRGTHPESQLRYPGDTDDARYMRGTFVLGASTAIGTKVLCTDADGRVTRYMDRANVKGFTDDEILDQLRK